MTPSITVTEAAREKVLAVARRSGKPDAWLRVAVTERRGARFIYEIDLVPAELAPPDDLRIDGQGIPLLIEPGSAEALEGAVIDLDASAMGGALTIDNPNEGWHDPLAARVQEIIDEQINPSVAAHGGFVDLLDVRDGAAYVQLGGGCQGCAQVDVTLRQGIEVAICRAVPQITRVIDTTDHASGANPYFQSAKKAS